MEAICFSETSGATQRTTRHHIPEDDTLHNHHCENLKSYIIFLISDYEIPNGFTEISHYDYDVFEQ
jgi:hypothetical protein